MNKCKHNDRHKAHKTTGTQVYPQLSGIVSSFPPYLKNSSRSQPAFSVIAEVRKEIKKWGPVSSADIAFNQIVDWSWSPTKLSGAALGSL